MIVQKGDKVSLDFELRNQLGEKVNLNEIKGKILFASHPLAFTSVCTDQMRDLENNFDEFEKYGVTAIGLSVDPHPSKGVWAHAIGVKKTTLVSDFNPKGALAQELGIYIEKAGISARANVLVEDGVVLWSKEYEKSQRPDIEEVLEVIRNLD